MPFMRFAKVFAGFFVVFFLLWLAERLRVVFRVPRFAKKNANPFSSIFKRFSQVVLSFTDAFHAFCEGFCRMFYGFSR